MTVALVAWRTLFALAPPRPRRSSPSNLSYWFGYLLNELPFVALSWLVASTLLAFGQGDIDSPGGWVAVGLAALTAAGLLIVAGRGLRTGPAVDRAMGEGLGAGWRAAIDPELAARLRRRLPWARILFGPFFVRRREVERIANISYGDAGTSILLDLYRHRSRPPGVPALVYLHGGAFRSRGKRHEARPLLYRLASQGWICVSYVRSDAPPFIVAHGDLDTVVLVEDARRFVEELRSTSSNPVVYAELPGAQHTFDLFHSIRFETAVDGVEAFAAWVRSRGRHDSQGPAPGERRLSRGGPDAPSP